jgi:DNA-binding transcriptional ArsR family regulator
MYSPEQVSRLLRAAGDATRLRLLRLCADRATTVSELAAALSDSEPNVSRHLKALAAAGLVQRRRRGQWVEYSALAADGPAGALLQWLLAQPDDPDPVLRQARSQLNRPAMRLAAGRDRLAVPVAIGSRFGRALRDALADDPGAPVAGRALVLQAANPEPLQWLQQRASETWLLAASVVERGALRRRLAQSGLRVEVALRSAVAAAAESGRFAAVLVDHSGTQHEVAQVLRTALRDASPWLAEGARVWLVADYDALERASGPGASPPRVLRELAAEAGLECDALRPVDADGRHVLVARCSRSEPGAALARTA